MALTKATVRNLGLRLNGERSELRSSSKIALQQKSSTDFDDTSEYSNLAEKIFQNFNTVLERDPLIDEFDILPVDSEANHSPVVHDGMQHKLALESWCVPYLYTHCYKSFLALRRHLPSSSPSNYPSFYGKSKASSLSENEKSARSVFLGRVLCLLNPDLTVVWNFRRRTFQFSSFQTFDNEIRLLNMVASRKPKCPEAFYYRKWLVDSAIPSRVIPSESLVEWVTVEFNSINHAVQRYFSNYHAWNYRLWLLRRVLSLVEVSAEHKRALILSEFNFLEKWTSTQVSDHCGYHYRQWVLRFLVDYNVELKDGSACDYETLLRNELKTNAQRILLFEGHETLWYHRRSILSDLYKLVFHDDQLKLLKQENELTYTVINRKVTDERCKWNMNLAKKHLQYLNRQFGWTTNLGS